MEKKKFTINAPVNQTPSGSIGPFQTGTPIESVISPQYIQNGNEGITYLEGSLNSGEELYKEATFTPEGFREVMIENQFDEQIDHQK